MRSLRSGRSCRTYHKTYTKGHRKVKLLQVLPLEVLKADCKRNLFALAFLYDVGGNFCVQHFCSFGAILLIVNLLIKTDSTVICVPYMLEHVCYEPFSFKKMQIWTISYLN